MEPATSPPRPDLLTKHRSSGHYPPMKRTLIVIILLLAACSTSAKPTATIGGTVYVDSGGGTPTPAGVTRTDFDDISKAITANDTVGLGQLVQSGSVVMVPACAPSKLLDTAFGGERQVRLASGDAVWVDANWIKDSASDCS